MFYKEMFKEYAGRLIQIENNVCQGDFMDEIDLVDLVSFVSKLTEQASRIHSEKMSHGIRMRLYYPDASITLISGGEDFFVDNPTDFCRHWDLMFFDFSKQAD